MTEIFIDERAVDGNFKEDMIQLQSEVYIQGHERHHGHVMAIWAFGDFRMIV